VREASMWAISSSSHHKRHDGKHSKYRVIDRSRHRVSAGEVLSDRQTPKPEHESKFSDEHEPQRDNTHAKSDRRHGGHSETLDYTPRRDNGNDEHDRRFHQLSHSRSEPRDDPECANGSKHKARSEHQCEIEPASFQNRHNILLSLGTLPHCPCVAKGNEAYHLSMTTIHPVCPDSGARYPFAAGVFLRQEPDEEEDEEEDDRKKENDDDDDDTTDDGYSE
jgi:hypothetical protein